MMLHSCKAGVLHSCKACVLHSCKVGDGNRSLMSLKMENMIWKDLLTDLELEVALV